MNEVEKYNATQKEILEGTLFVDLRLALVYHIGDDVRVRCLKTGERFAIPKNANFESLKLGVGDIMETEMVGSQERGIVRVVLRKHEFSTMDDDLIIKE